MHHCYATANEQKFFATDIDNLLKIYRNPHGLEKLKLHIAVSEVRTPGTHDKLFKFLITRLFKKHKSIELVHFDYKSNIGRDFSSYQNLFESVKENCSKNDFILFQNRSGFGPNKNNWYRSFIDLFEKHDNTALSGITINFKDHPERSFNINCQHVQTYAFITQFHFLTHFPNGQFPGSEESTQLGVVLNGEIELSQFFLRQNYGISCFEWPDKFITHSTKAFVEEDIKESTKTDHIFNHRNKYKNKIGRLKSKIKYLSNLIHLIFKI